MKKVVYEQQLQGTPACIPAQAITDWLQQTFGRQA
jgi:hypothetical protein